MERLGNGQVVFALNGRIDREGIAESNREIYEMTTLKEMTSKVTNDTVGTGSHEVACCASDVSSK
jgi:hypothetical protein